MKRTPETLFEKIAQDNEIIQYFKHHSMRVMYLSTMLAKKVGHYDEDLRIAALLHDIGKMGLSKDILLKAGTFTQLERTIIESHCHIGNVIVRKELGKVHSAEYIRDHHEDWNGKGYPRRLVGEEISIQGRIIRICDSFDAMTYDMRNYQKTKMSYSEAFNELRKCSWKQYDGNLVEEFISLMNDIGLPYSWYNKFDETFVKRIYSKIEGMEDLL
ncbi:HD-GYP domain-containing protein [Sediminibacillus albus]|uniref:HD-GYP domain-containing protein n=1 Tax=Sediminibacillus albus TaxID=407036 RepID=UPI001113BD51|nr:HD domain-containing phosphohydrolase [Sediminibacillus albus]